MEKLNIDNFKYESDIKSMIKDILTLKIRHNIDLTDGKKVNEIQSLLLNFFVQRDSLNENDSNNLNKILNYLEKSFRITLRVFSDTTLTEKETSALNTMKNEYIKIKAQIIKILINSKKSLEERINGILVYPVLITNIIKNLFTDQSLLSNIIL